MYDADFAGLHRQLLGLLDGRQNQFRGYSGLVPHRCMTRVAHSRQQLADKLRCGRIHFADRRRRPAQPRTLPHQQAIS